MRPWWLLLTAAIAGLVIYQIVDERNDQKRRVEFRKSEAEYHEQFVKKEKAKADAVNAQIAADREARVKAFMKANPSWTHDRALKRILADELEADGIVRNEYDAARKREDITRTCALIYGTTNS